MKFTFSLFLFLCFKSTFSSHFRGGLITWKPIQPNITFPVKTIDVLITNRFYWRKESSGGCSPNGGSLIGDGNLIFTNSFHIATSVYCNEQSIAEDWYGGERSQTVSFDVSSSYILEASFTGCCWISTLVYGKDTSWETRVKLNLTKRTDTKMINTSPITLMEPIQRLTANCNYKLKIPVEDIDGDAIKCRWSTLAKKECIGVCGPIPGVVLDETNCFMTVNIKQTGHYAASIQIEDYSPLQTQPLSSIPLKFLFYVTNGACVVQNVTNSVIKFHEATRPLNDACVGLKPKNLFSENVVVYSESKVTEITVQGPGGITKSEIKTYLNNASLYYVTVSWTPSQEQTGLHLFRLKATNIQGFSTSDEYVFRVVVGGGSPVFYEPFPRFHVTQKNGYNFKLKSNIPIKNANRSSFIQIYEKSNDNLVDRIQSNSLNIAKNILSFKSNADFKVNSAYYILVDEGLVSSLEYCGVDSFKINNKTFWQFSLLRDFDGHLNAEYLEALGYSNDAIKIDLHDHKITTIDQSTFNGQNGLVNLDLSLNQLTSIDLTTFNILNQLEKLNFSSNNLSIADFAQFTNLQNLKELYLDDNMINSLDITPMIGLTQLSVSDNRLETVNSSIFNQLTNLECLYLNNNNLVKIESKAFDNLSNLKCLYLNNNKLKSIELNIFDKLVNLNYLNLQSNNLVSFDRNALSNINSLETVCLRGNLVVDYFPTSFKSICATSPKCEPKIIDWCLE